MGPSLRSENIRGISRAQRVARQVVLDAASLVRVGDTERVVVSRMEGAFAQAGVHRWLHTPYAWWGERTRFGGFGAWEPSALPSNRRLAEGEAFILDAAPLVEGHPADFATSGVAGSDPAAQATHQSLLADLAAVKVELTGWAQRTATGKELVRWVDTAIRGRGREVIHSLYPAGTLGHSLEGFPNVFGHVPRMGSGFQWPLLGRYAVALVGHHLVGSAYPFLNELAPGKPQGLFAVEPHLAQGAMGAKFESILLIDGDETRWLDPGLFGEVTA